MTETQKRIKAYKAALPGLRERVVAVALLLAMSLAMMTSASFAWLTISRSPEVTGVNTTIASNGNLEIALATSNEKPGESQVGDSSAAEGQSVTAANITWGNLVNLSDPSYGLESMTLRPAWLNESSLLVSPLYGALYGQDGRISQLASNFAYTTWDADTGKFMVTDSVDTLGVRAISSTELAEVEHQEEAIKKYNMRNVAESANLDAGIAYVAITNNKAYMDSLANIMGVFMTARMNAGQGDESLTNPSMNQADVQNLQNIFAAFVKAYDLQFTAWAELANYKLFMLNGDSYEKKTAEYMKTTATDVLSKEGVLFTGLKTARSDYAKLEDGLAKLEVLSTQGSVKWSDSGLDDIVNSLMNIGTCTVEGTPINNIGASNATSYLGRTNEAKITNGVLYNFEQINGARCDVKDLSISAKVKRSGITIPASVSANISTTAATPFYFPTDLAKVDELNTGKIAQVANDTYGLAIDLWVRTNAEGSYLTLEGNVMTEVDEDVPVLGTDSSGNQVNIYTLTRTATETAENGTTSEISYTEEIYKKETQAEDGTVTVTWYDAETHTVFKLENGEEPRQKVEDVVTIVGYEGENRIWGDNQLLSADSTTQGSGSCYVYYADTPEDQARSLKLLEAFNVAFVDDKGNLLAKAVMDTERNYAANGRVTVPLVLATGNSINLGEDAQGNVTYAIASLQKNLPTRITAIVFLDGTKLTNQEVLAAADIQGQLNIQFGSSNALAPIENEELESKERRVSAAVDVAKFEYDTATGPMTTNVTVHVDGDEPSTVTAFFMRAINSTQGSREETMTFTKNDEGDWVSSYTFTAPGNYVLRTVQLDGVDYTLTTPPEVIVTGFAVKSLSCTQATGNHINIMTAADSSTVDLNLKFATDDVDKMPTTVQGRFLRDDDGSAVNVNFTYNATSEFWTGSATFLTSGEYTMQFLTLDGQYVELDSALWQTADVTLGMRVAIYTTSPHSFKYVPSEMAANEKLLGMQVKIMDNTGEEMPGMYGVKLVYGMKGSSTKTMDADLTWDGDYYVGELTTTGPGVWQFSNVTVGGNVLTASTTYPTFTILSPEPPEYYYHNTVAYQYKPNPKTDPAVMNAQITHSAAASVQAYIIKDGATEGTWVTGTLGVEFTTTDNTPANNWTFAVPGDANGYQDGNWQILEIKMCDVYAADGTAYTAENPLVFDVSNKDIKTKVVNRVSVSFATDKSKDFGKTYNEETKQWEVTSQFMTSHTVSGLNVDIKDFEGNPVDGVSDVKLTFTYQNGSSATYGKYTSNDLTNATEGAKITVALDTNSGTTYSQSQPATFLYAGKYITTFSFKISNTEYKYGDLNGNDFKDTDETDLPANAPVFTVSSKAPTVTISSVTSNAVSDRFFTTTNPSSYDHVTTGLKNWKSENGYSASVFIYVAGPSGPADSEIVSLKYPTINVTLEGIPKDHSGVSFVVPNGTNSSYSNTFKFESGELTTSSTIGAGQNGAIDYGILGASISSWPRVYPVGKQQIKTINVTYDGMDFVMTLSHPVNISQTTVPPYAELTIDESSYSGATRVYSEDTENVVLSKMTWSVNGIETGDDATISGWSSKTIHTDHGYKTWKWWYITSERYMPFYWTEFSRTISGTQTPYTTTYTINKWIVNGKEYDVSKNAVSFPVTSSIQATAVITVTTEYGTTTQTTVTEYKYGYLAGTQQNGNPGGSQIGGTVNSENGAYDNPSIGIANTSTGANMYDDKDKYLECTNRG